MPTTEEALIFFTDSVELLKSVNSDNTRLLGFYEAAIEALESQRKCERCENAMLDSVLEMPELSRAMDTVDEAYQLIIQDMRETGGENAWKFFPSNWSKAKPPYDKPPFDTTA